MFWGFLLLLSLFIKINEILFPGVKKQFSNSMNVTLPQFKRICLLIFSKQILSKRLKVKPILQGLHKRKLIKSSKLKRIWLWNQKRVYALVLQLPKYENLDKLNSFNLNSHLRKRDITALP